VATKDKGKGKAKDASHTASSTRKVHIEDDVQDEDMDDTVDTTNPTPATTSTTPFDFASFVPTHDPSLGLGAGVGSGGSAALPPAFGQPGQSAFASASASAATGENVKIVSRDEAFQNALSSMYWTGYWTAAYYVSQGPRFSSFYLVVLLELIVW
jgi:hypothetical protein